MTLKPAPEPAGVFATPAQPAAPVDVTMVLDVSEFDGKEYEVGHSIRLGVTIAGDNIADLDSTEVRFFINDQIVEELSHYTVAPTGEMTFWTYTLVPVSGENRIYEQYSPAPYEVTYTSNVATVMALSAVLDVFAGHGDLFSVDAEAVFGQPIKVWALANMPVTSPTETLTGEAEMFAVDAKFLDASVDEIDSFDSYEEFFAQYLTSLGKTGFSQSNFPYLPVAPEDVELKGFWNELGTKVLPIGEWSFVAQFDGNERFRKSPYPTGRGVTRLTIVQAESTLTVSGPTSVASDSTTDLVATVRPVAPSQAVPSGDVEFFIDGEPAGIFPLSDASIGADFAARAVLKDFAGDLGAYEITAKFVGDENISGSNGGTSIDVVKPAPKLVEPTEEPVDPTDKPVDPTEKPVEPAEQGQGNGGSGGKKDVDTTVTDGKNAKDDLAQTGVQGVGTALAAAAVLLLSGLALARKKQARF